MTAQLPLAGLLKYAKVRCHFGEISWQKDQRRLWTLQLSMSFYPCTYQSYQIHNELQIVSIPVGLQLQTSNWKYFLFIDKIHYTRHCEIFLIFSTG